MNVKCVCFVRWPPGSSDVIERAAMSSFILDNGTYTRCEGRYLSRLRRKCCDVARLYYEVTLNSIVTVIT